MTDATAGKPRVSWLRRFLAAVCRNAIIVTLGVVVAALATYLLRKIGF